MMMLLLLMIILRFDYSLSLASSSYWLVTRNYTPVGDIYTHTNPPGRNGLISIANNDASDIGKQADLDDDCDDHKDDDDGYDDDDDGYNDDDDDDDD